MATVVHVDWKVYGMPDSAIPTAPEKAKATAEWRAAYLAAVSTGLAECLSPEQAIDRALRLGVEGFAACSAVFTQVEGSLRCQGVAHRDPAMERRVLLPGDSFPAPEGAGILESAMQSPGPTIIAEEEHLRSLLPGSDGDADLRSSCSGNAVLVPLRARGRTFGVAAFFGGEAGELDVQLAVTLSQTAALSIDNMVLYREAKEATRARDELLSIVAHDLRSPLGAISVSAEMLLEFDLGEQARRYHLEIVQRASARMNRLIQDLADVAKIESGKLLLDRARHQIKEILDESCEMFLTRTDANLIDLTWVVEEGVRYIWGDRYRLLQVLSNLLDNATKFTKAGGRIALRAVVHDGGVLITVHDNGSGIAAEDLPFVFERFWHAGDGGASGAGLGLAIAKGIVEAHGGTIWVESRLGEGACFYLTLPLGAPDSSSIADAENRESRESGVGPSG